MDKIPKNYYLRCNQCKALLFKTLVDTKVRNIIQLSMVKNYQKFEIGDHCFCKQCGNAFTYNTTRWEKLEHIELPLYQTLLEIGDERL